jgi:hypothetical protein
LGILEINIKSQNMRIIKTARDEESINQAAKNGFYPLLKKVEPSEDISSKFAVLQNKKSGEIEVVGDYRMLMDSDRDIEYEVVIEWTYYYPYKFSAPFAAYLIPKDIVIGERVFIEDLIEDFVGSTWNQGDTYRLENCEAVWNGSNFDIQYDPGENRTDYIG